MFWNVKFRNRAKKQATDEYVEIHLRGIPSNKGELVEEEAKGYRKLFGNTRGIWTKGDGLKFQSQIRKDFDPLKHEFVEIPYSI